MRAIVHTNRQPPQPLASGAGPESRQNNVPTALALRHPLEQLQWTRSHEKNAGIAAQRACTLAVADTDLKNLPAPLQKSLRGNALKSAQLDNGVLRLQMDKPAVSELVYSTFVFHNICAEQWHNPEQFAKLGPDAGGTAQRHGQQGFAFDARGDVCVQMGQLGKNFRTFIGQRTVKCTAGACPRP
jgi:hypothetical protein